MDFKTLYAQTTDKAKLDFLNGIISNNAKLQEAFVNFAGEPKNENAALTKEEFAEIVAETQSEYIENFEMVDLENPDWDNYNPSHSGYIEEWEQYQEAGEQEFQEIFDSFYDFAIDTIIRQKVDELTAMLIGLFEATKEAEVDDEYDSFGDVNEYLLTEHKTVLNRIIEKLKLSAISEQSLLNAFTLFFSYSETGNKANQKYPNYFEDFLLALAEKSTMSEAMLNIIERSGVAQETIPRLMLLLRQQAGNPDEWLKTAIAYYRHDNEVARQLLHHYFENNSAEFLNLARELFAKDRSYWAQKLRDYVSPEADMKLFIDVYIRLILDKQAMVDYQKLRPHLSPESLEKLLEDIDAHGWDKSFLATLLATENRHAELREHIEKRPDNWQTPKIMRLILEAYPEFCFNRIKSTVQKMLKTQRGRYIYQQAVEWLQLADTIPGHKPQNRILARELYNHKPNLPALKDELRKGGLV